MPTKPQLRELTNIPPAIPNKTIKTVERGNGTIKRVTKTSKMMVKGTTKGVAKSAKVSIKSTNKTARIAVKTAQRTAQNTQRMIASTIRATKIAVKVAQITLKAMIAAVKVTVKGVSALASAILAGGWIAVIIVLIIVIFAGALSLIFGGGTNNTTSTLSSEVEAYEPLIIKYAHEHGVSDYIDLIKAVMMQESAGQGTDPMQCAECEYNIEYPNKPNGILDPEYSINIGIKYLARCLQDAKVRDPIDLDNIKTALQGYNYGNGYIAWVQSREGVYTPQNAVEFASIMASRYGWASYGDSLYVPHVLRYYPLGKTPSGFGNQDIVNVALSQVGNVGGEPYWRWFGSGSRFEWCAAFVSWCANECGFIDSGIIPKFSTVHTEGEPWFKERGQWKNAGYNPQAGDLIFFDWEGDGTCDHVGIVEKSENGRVYTIEGNSGDMCKQKSYAVDSTVIYGYGVPRY